MNVKDTVTYPEYPQYAIEWGISTWTEHLPSNKQLYSIRNRYNLKSGRFNKAASGEIPWEDFQSMISESIRKKHFSPEELATILNEIAGSLRQQ
jgi:hypothetical protein